MACGFRDLGFGFRGRQLSLFLDIRSEYAHTHSRLCSFVVYQYTANDTCMSSQGLCRVVLVNLHTLVRVCTRDVPLSTGQFFETPKTHILHKTPKLGSVREQQSRSSECLKPKNPKPQTP